jgi:transcriptional regulator with XRE-family HTH domain
MNLEEYLRQKLEQDPEFRREWEAEEPAIGVRCALIGARSHLGLTQAELAERVGTTQAYISRAEADGGVSLEFLTRCAAALGGSATFVLKLPGSQQASVDAIRFVQRQARTTSPSPSSVNAKRRTLVRPRRARRGMTT